MNASIFVGKTLLITGGTGTFGNAVDLCHSSWPRAVRRLDSKLGVICLCRRYYEYEIVTSEKAWLMR